jgi:hypothetical protein
MTPDVHIEETTRRSKVKGDRCHTTSCVRQVFMLAFGHDGRDWKFNSVVLPPSRDRNRVAVDGIHFYDRACSRERCQLDQRGYAVWAIRRDERDNFPLIRIITHERLRIVPLPSSAERHSLHEADKDSLCCDKLRILGENGCLVRAKHLVRPSCAQRSSCRGAD